METDVTWHQQGKDKLLSYTREKIEHIFTHISLPIWVIKNSLLDKLTGRDPRSTTYQYKQQNDKQYLVFKIFLLLLFSWKTKTNKKQQLQTNNNNQRRKKNAHS